MKVEKTQNRKNKITLGIILNSPISIIVVLILFSIGLLIYTRYLVRCNKIYTFSGYSSDFSFFGGTLYEGPNVNFFGDSKVLYTGENVELYDYEVGFYIKYGEDDYSPISAMTGIDTREDDTSKQEGASLKDILSGTDFSFTENHKGAKYLSIKNMENLENLVFRITGKDGEGNSIDMEVPLEVEKITK